MTWSYNAGTTTPTFAGLVEVNGIRFNNGTYRTQALPFLIDTPTLRTVASDLPSDHGGVLGPSFYGPREGPIDGWLSASSVEDVISAREYLKAAFAQVSPTAMSTLVYDSLGFSPKRQCAVRVAGPIVFEEPEIILKKVARRDFSIPLIVPDPLLYDAVTVQSVTLPMDGTSHTLVGGGSMPAPFTARFTGPWTTAANLIDNASGIAITLTMSLTAGHYVDVDLTDISDPKATDDTGASQFGAITVRSLRRVQPGSNSWKATATAGTTGASQVTVTYRNAWI